MILGSTAFASGSRAGAKAAAAPELEVWSGDGTALVPEAKGEADRTGEGEDVGGVEDANAGVLFGVGAGGADGAPDFIKLRAALRVLSAWLATIGLCSAKFSPSLETGCPPG